MFIGRRHPGDIDFTEGTVMICSWPDLFVAESVRGLFDFQLTEASLTSWVMSYQHRRWKVDPSAHGDPVPTNCPRRSPVEAGEWEG